LIAHCEHHWTNKQTDGATRDHAAERADQDHRHRHCDATSEQQGLEHIVSQAGDDLIDRKGNRCRERSGAAIAVSVPFLPLLRQDQARLHRLNVPMTLHDAKNDPIARDRLLAGGGKIKVPCLHIQEEGQSRWIGLLATREW
jgi:hypothetical protein